MDDATAKDQVPRNQPQDAPSEGGKDNNCRLPLLVGSAGIVSAGCSAPMVSRQIYRWQKSFTPWRASAALSKGRILTPSW